MAWMGHTSAVRSRRSYAGYYVMHSLHTAEIDGLDQLFITSNIFRRLGGYLEYNSSRPQVGHYNIGAHEIQGMPLCVA